MKVLQGSFEVPFIRSEIGDSPTLGSFVQRIGDLLFEPGFLECESYDNRRGVAGKFGSADLQICPGGVPVGICYWIERNLIRFIGMVIRENKIAQRFVEIVFDALVVVDGSTNDNCRVVFVELPHHFVRSLHGGGLPFRRHYSQYHDEDEHEYRCREVVSLHIVDRFHRECT